MLDRVQGNGNGYFSQAVAGYAQRMKPNSGQDQKDPKTIGEFSEKEWRKLLAKVDNAVGGDEESPKRHKTKALSQEEGQAEQYILGSSARAAKDLEQWLNRGTDAEEMDSVKSGGEPQGAVKPEKQEGSADTVADELIQRLLGTGKQAPYSSMADENGMVIYNGVTFQCDYENNRLCLGNVSNLKDCICVALEKGGSLVVNRENIDQLSKAIGMFSPEDVNRIMRAIAQDAKIRQTQMQIEDETSGVEVIERPEDKNQRQGPAEGPDKEKEQNT